MGELFSGQFFSLFACMYFVWSCCSDTFLVGAHASCVMTYASPLVWKRSSYCPQLAHAPLFQASLSLTKWVHIQRNLPFLCISSMGLFSFKTHKWQGFHQDNSTPSFPGSSNSLQRLKPQYNNKCDECWPCALQALDLQRGLVVA